MIMGSGDWYVTKQSDYPKHDEKNAGTVRLSIKLSNHRNIERAIVGTNERIVDRMNIGTGTQAQGTGVNVTAKHTVSPIVCAGQLLSILVSAASSRLVTLRSAALMLTRHPTPGHGFQVTCTAKCGLVYLGGPDRRSARHPGGPIPVNPNQPKQVLPVRPGRLLYR